MRVYTFYSFPVLCPTRTVIPTLVQLSDRCALSACSTLVNYCRSIAPPLSCLSAGLFFTFALLILFVTSLVLGIPGLAPGLTSFINALDWVTLVFPPYGMARGIGNIGSAATCSPLLIAAGKRMQ